MLNIRGSHLRTMRYFGDKTTQQMAEAAGLKCRKTYENWEANRSTPNINQFIAVVRLCGLDYIKVLGYIMGAKAKTQFDLMLLMALCGKGE